MRDSFGRTIDYLRLSVTDRCNYRCRYCVKDPDFCPARDLLSLEECVEIVHAAAACGVRKVRLTGGEPLVRRDILDLCRAVSQVPAIEELCLTTNASLLPQYAVPLRQAGVSRLNISLDTLREDRFAALSRTGHLSDATAGIQSALDAGFSRLKINMVLIGGFNDDEIPDFVRLTLDHPWEIRFIELMPMGPCADWPKSCFLPCTTVLERCPDLQPVGVQGVADCWQLPGAAGRVGLISPVSHTFCGQCRRIRVTADGHLKVCLHSREEVSLRGLTGSDLANAIRIAIEAKPEHHHLERGRSETPRTMNQIGG